MQATRSVVARLRAVVITCVALALAVGGLAMQPAAAATKLTLSGTGTTVTEPFELEPGFYSVLFSFQSAASVVVTADVVSEEQGVIGTAVVQGTDEVTKPMVVSRGEKLWLDVDAADGVVWTATLAKMKLPSRPTSRISLSGLGSSHAVLSLLAPGVYTYSVASHRDKSMGMKIGQADSDGSNVRYLAEFTLKDKPVSRVAFTVTVPTIVWVEPIVEDGDLGWSFLVEESSPRIVGTAQVGKKIKADRGAWVPAGAKVTYQWWRRPAGTSSGANTKIKGATKSTYKVAPADKGAWITVTVTAKESGKPAVTKRSDKKRGLAGELTSKTPKVSGTLKVGKKLTVKPGTWAPSGVKFTYQWLRDGKVIGCASTSTYTLTKAEKGKKISVIVKGYKSGYKSVKLTTKETAKVRS